ncbi:Zn-dependent hydrolase [Solibacillus sp. FSL K6-4121]|uniref:Zn-dependent hydrolase n=1 Tax=Solibacillus sp. FSL K6-4121 TaxID=2921505 RepID=UPI0030F5FD3F
MINEERLLLHLTELAKIGSTPEGGVNRFSFTAEEMVANLYIKQLMEAAGMTVSTDAIGNIIGEINSHIDAPAILLGSHIDTVPNGGHYDGALGVLSAIEVIHTLQDNDIPLKRPVKVIAFKDEEGTRFQFGMIGSRAAAGTLQLEELQRTDEEGISIAEAMQQDGLDASNVADAKLSNVECYVELHIEQGKVLEKTDVGVGVVTGIAGPLWQQITLTGTAEHAGATPMALRQDALVGASLIIAKIEELARQYPAAVATVGKLSVSPNGVNVIPGEVTFTVDIRDIEEEVRNTLEQEIHHAAQAIAQERQLTLSIETLQRVAPVKCDAEIQQIIAQAITDNGQQVVHLPSGAGHDAMQFYGQFPVAMIFVRSKDGISHNPKEFTSTEDIIAGANVLKQTLLELDQR